MTQGDHSQSTARRRFLIRRPDALLNQFDAGWRYLSFQVLTLNTGSREAHTGEQEVAVIPLSGSVEIRAEEETFHLGGRPNVFDGLPEALYLPRDTSWRFTGDGPVEVAVAGAKCHQRLVPRLVTQKDYAVETRGAGNATRQVITLLGPAFPSERLLIVEVLTPAGNWSSYPPHKHDESRAPEESPLEETYYYRLRGENGFALQRLYSPSRSVDEAIVVLDRDLVFVPWGYHTTCAAPGYDLYYLNALAGDEHVLSAYEDPALAWVRQSWETQAPDPRVPLVGGDLAKRT